MLTYYAAVRIELHTPYLKSNTDLSPFELKIFTSVFVRPW